MVGLTRPVALVGLGGAGKTNIAVEYAYQHRTDFEYIFWVCAETDTDLIKGFINIAKELDLPIASEATYANDLLVVDAAKKWLESNSRWLLIFDNVDDLRLVRQYIPIRQEGGAILLTTQTSAVGSLAFPVPVGKLSNEDGAVLLLRRAHILMDSDPLEAASMQDREAAMTLSAEMEGLPLAMIQAGAFLEGTNNTPKRYLELFQRRSDELLRRGGDEEDRSHVSVSATFGLAFDKLDEDCVAASDLLRACAYLSADEIPEDIFLLGKNAFTCQLHEALKDEIAWEEIIARVRRYSLLDRNGNERTLRIHRLVQAVLRERNRSNDGEWIKRVTQAIRLTLPPPEVGLKPEHEKYAVQALSVFNLMDRLGVEVPEAGDLWYQLAHFLRIRIYSDGEKTSIINKKGYDLSPIKIYDLIEKLYVSAIGAKAKALGIDHPSLAPILSRLSTFYRIHNRYEEAEIKGSQALQIRRQSLGKYHPDVVVSLNNLANLYLDQGLYEQAEQYYLEAIRIFEHTNNLYPADLAFVKNGLANVYVQQNNFKTAENLYKEAIDIWKKTSPDNTLQIGYALFGLAKVYFPLGHYTDAENACNQVLGLWNEGLPVEGDNESDMQGSHRYPPLLGYTLGLLGDIAQKKNDNTTAFGYYRRALKILEDVFDENHTDLVEIKRKYNQVSI
jgi:tetratricopeptide (TPR) repeat protein